MLSLTDLDVQRLRLPAAQDFDRRRFACDIAVEARKQFIVMQDGRACNSHQNISNDQAAFGCWAVVFHANHQKACGLLAFERLLRSSGDFNGLAANPKITALDAAMLC